MKTLKQFFSVVALCVAGIFAFASCTVGPDGGKDAPHVVPFSVTYSTGAAVWNEADPDSSELVLTKLGTGSTGTQAFLAVTSSIYWTVSVEYPNATEENPENWMSVSPKGGPAPAQTKTNVYLDLKQNLGEDRTAYVVFSTMDKTYKVAVRQRGPLTDPTQGKLRFLEDHFGKTVAAQTVVKFYPFSDAEGNKTYSGVAAAGGQFKFGYTGSENAYASKEDPSYGYVDPLYDGEASGGVNIMIDGKGYFDVKNFNNQHKTDFYLTFGAKNCDGKFRTEDLKLLISCDQNYWEEMPYHHDYDTNKTNDWALNSIGFSIAPNISDILYFRFENTSEDLYRIDDLFVIEHDPSEDNLFPLIIYGSDIIGMPTTFKFNDLSTDNVKGQNWAAFAMVLSEESGAYEEADESGEGGAAIEFAAASYTSAHMQFVCGTDASLVKRRTDGNGVVVTSSSPKVQGAIEQDYWIWTFPVYNTAPMTNIKCEISHMATDAGAKYYIFETAQCTKDEYKLAGQFLGGVPDAELTAFYNSLDWKIYDPVEIEVPNEEDPGRGTGIPVGTGKEEKVLWSGTILASNGFAGQKGQMNCNNTAIVTFEEAMEEGYYFMRLRFASNLTTGPTNDTVYQRINKVDHSGTNYLRDIAKFTFHSTGSVIADTSGRYQFLSIIGDMANYTGEAATFLRGSSMGMFAGSTPNLSSESTGNNVFQGVCPNDELGNSVYVYYPYDATNENAENVKLSIPAKQYFADGYLVCNAAPFMMTNKQVFRTARTIRCDVKTPAALLNLNVYTGEYLNNKLWRIDLESDTEIGGSRTYNLKTLEDLGVNNYTNTVTAEAAEAISISDQLLDPTSVYVSLWPGQHTLTAKLYLGKYVYTVPLEAMEFTEGEVESVTICLDDYEAVLDDSVEVTAINSAEMLREFLNDLSAGKEGEEMQKYRTIDGSYGLGADIDMSSVDMNTWPQVTLTENFNGCGFRIKNMVISKQNVALFANVAYGKTLSNVVLDESCKLKAEIKITSGQNIDWTWSLLVKGGNPSSTAANCVVSGNIDNCVSYAPIEITRTGDVKDNFNIGAFIGAASGAPTDNDAPSAISNCKNYGDILIHDFNQATYNVEHPYYYYHQIGGIIGKAGGYVVTNCENHGNIIVENCNMVTGSLYLGGIVGYNCNRVDSNTSNLMGDINNCRNYGKLLVGQDESKPVKFYNVGLAGICSRFQWGSVTQCDNYGEIKVKAVQSDPFKNGWTTSKSYSDWASYLGKTTNANGFFSVGGIATFAQSNMDIGVDFRGLNNWADIDAEIDTEFAYGEPGAIYYADNLGICVGGVMGLMGANAKNPRYTECSNMANVRLKSNKTASEAFVGGVIGKTASNRNVKDADFYSVTGCANVGKVEFVTDSPETTIAHVGGVVGAAIAGKINTCINGGNVSNQSTNEQSTVGSILGAQHNSNIGFSNVTATPKMEMKGASVGGSINGVAVTKENFEQYLYGKAQTLDIYVEAPQFFSFE